MGVTLIIKGINCPTNDLTGCGAAHRTDCLTTHVENMAIPTTEACYVFLFQETESLHILSGELTGYPFGPYICYISISRMEGDPQIVPIF
jgi:hypothetical protein